MSKSLGTRCSANNHLAQRTSPVVLKLQVLYPFQYFVPAHENVPVEPFHVDAQKINPGILLDEFIGVRVECVLRYFRAVSLRFFVLTVREAHILHTNLLSGLFTRKQRNAVGGGHGCVGDHQGILPAELIRRTIQLIGGLWHGFDTEYGGIEGGGCTGTG